MKKNFQNVILVIMLIALVACLFQISSLKIEVQNLRNHLGNKISNLENDMRNHTGSIERLLEEKASILAKSDWEYGEVNIQNHSVEIICRITPKEYHPEHTAASVMIGNQEIGMDLLNGEFIGKAEVSLFEETPVSKVIFYVDDVIRSEALDWMVTPLYEYIPSINAYLSGSGTSGKKDGKYIWKSNGTLDIFADQKGGTFVPETAALIRCLDGIEVEKTNIPLDKNVQVGEPYCYDADLEYEIPFGSRQELYVEMQDTNGLRYRTLFECVEVAKDGSRVEYGSPNEIGETIIYGLGGEELYRGFW